MCDYSLHHVASRPAAVDDRIVTTTFPGTMTRGFCAEGAANEVVCLRPGTEIAFTDDVRFYEEVTHFPTSAAGKASAAGRVARFRQVELDNAYAHHDALEFPDGRIVLVTRLCEGQHATVLQLPAAPMPAKAEADNAGVEAAAKAVAA